MRTTNKIYYSFDKVSGVLDLEDEAFYLDDTVFPDVVGALGWAYGLKGEGAV